MYIVHEGKFITLSCQHSTKPTRDYNGCSVLRRYFAQLHLLRARFPPETVGQIPVDFAWWVGPLSLSHSLTRTHTQMHIFILYTAGPLSVSVSIYIAHPPFPSLSLPSLRTHKTHTFTLYTAGPLYLCIYI